MKAHRVDHLAQVVALRQLAGRELPLHHRIAAVCDAIETLHTSARNWRAFAPRPAVLESAIAQADAVARGLRELRGALDAKGESPDAA
jgi:hypothetical protein